jgi:hypothetical protein
LRCVTTACYAYADIDVCYPNFSTFPNIIDLSCHTEFIKTENEDWFVDLESKDFGLNEGERLSVYFDETFAILAVGDGYGYVSY